MAQEQTLFHRLRHRLHEEDKDAMVFVGKFEGEANLPQTGLPPMYGWVDTSSKGVVVGFNVRVLSEICSEEARAADPPIHADDATIQSAVDEFMRAARAALEKSLVESVQLLADAPTLH